MYIVTSTRGKGRTAICLYLVILPCVSEQGRENSMTTGNVYSVHIIPYAQYNARHNTVYVSPLLVE